MFWKLGIIITVAGFVVVGILLATDHPGFAIKITSYIYLLLLVTVLLKIKMERTA